MPGKIQHRAAGHHARQVVRIEQALAVIAQLAIVAHGQVFAAALVVKIGVHIIGADLQVLVGIKIAHAVGHNRALFQGSKAGKGFVAGDFLVAGGFDCAGGRAFRCHRLVIRGFDRFGSGGQLFAVAVSGRRELYDAGLRGACLQPFSRVYCPFPCVVATVRVVGVGI